MGRIVDWARTVALTFGAPGLFLVAFLDSSFLSLPEIADILVIYMVTRHKPRAAIYVISATLGSLVGCLLMYYIGRKGGEALVRRRFATANVERTLATIRRHGLMAVLIPSLLPPPMPFKIFVLLAGGAGISVGRFTAAVAIGRGLRYVALGVLAVRYGDRAMAYLRENGVQVSVIAVGILVIGFIAYQRWCKAQAQESR